MLNASPGFFFGFLFIRFTFCIAEQMTKTQQTGHWGGEEEGSERKKANQVNKKNKEINV